MNRLLLLAVLVCLATTFSCGDIFVRGAINAGSQSAIGLVSIVQFSAGSTSGVSITIITLTANGMASTHGFCGDQRTLFPVDSQVRVSFTAGNPCDRVISVVPG